MLLANYASDSDSDAEDNAGPSRPPSFDPAPARSSQTAAAAVVNASVKPKKRGPVKITLDLPKASATSIDGHPSGDDEDTTREDEEDDEVERPAKKSKLQGKGR